jgi:hypothetical protein
VLPGTARQSKPKFPTGPGQSSTSSSGQCVRGNTGFSLFLGLGTKVISFVFHFCYLFVLVPSSHEKSLYTGVFFFLFFLCLGIEWGYGNGNWTGTGHYSVDFLLFSDDYWDWGWIGTFYFIRMFSPLFGIRLIDRISQNQKYKILFLLLSVHNASMINGNP